MIGLLKPKNKFIFIGQCFTEQVLYRNTRPVPPSPSMFRSQNMYIIGNCQLFTCFDDIKDYYSILYIHRGTYTKLYEFH